MTAAAAIEQQGGGVVGGHVQLPGRHGVKVVLVASPGAQFLETAGRIDIPWGEQIGHRGQGAGGGQDIAQAKGEGLVAFEHLGQAEFALRAHDQHRGVAVNAGRIEGAGEDLAAGPANRLQPRAVGKPAEIALLELHRLDEEGVVAGKERLHLQAGLGRHVGEDRRPVLLHALGRFGGEDGEADLAGRPRAGRSRALSASREGNSRQAQPGERASGDHVACASQNASSNSGP